MASENSLVTEFKDIVASLVELPYCSGTVTLGAQSSKLFYLQSKEGRCIDFARATESDLVSLSQTCEKATFGMNQEDVLDESYRRAGKIDAEEVATQFSPFSSGIVNTVRDSLFSSTASDKDLNLELYKLNVYGPGSFFKAHVDTPHSDSMVGSLVVVLPTEHKGGSLLFRHRGEERTFDTASMISSKDSLHAAYVAFYSDVEHEVLEVTAGYRVTLTYNIYLVDCPRPAPMSPSEPIVGRLQSVLSKLIRSGDFLPEGGLIGFGLSHRYPFNPWQTKLHDLSGLLKGVDARLLSICHELGLQPSIMAFYCNAGSNGNGKSCVVNEFVALNDFDNDMQFDVVGYIHEVWNGILLQIDKETLQDNEYDEDDEDSPMSREKMKDAVPMIWIKPRTKSNRFITPYVVAYGNNPTWTTLMGKFA